MKSLMKLWALSPAERRFAVRAWLFAPLVELSLHHLGIQRTLGYIEGLSQQGLAVFAGGVGDARGVSAIRGGQLIDAVYRRHVVSGACLPRAALQYGLHRLDGQDVSFVIGVRRDRDGHAASTDGGHAIDLDAHAWVAPPDSDVTAYAEPGFDPLMHRKSGVHV